MLGVDFDALSSCDSFICSCIMVKFIYKTRLDLLNDHTPLAIQDLNI